MRTAAVILALILFTAPALAQAPAGQSQAGSVQGEQALPGRQPVPGQTTVRPGRADRTLPLAFLFRLTDLTAEQKARLCGEGYEVYTRMTRAEAELRNLRLKLVCLQQQEEVNETEIKGLYAKIAELEAEAFIGRREYAGVVKSILTEQQLERLGQRRAPRRPLKRRTQ